ncbi:MAG: CotH kinase family protein [bacterium]
MKRISIILFFLSLTLNIYSQNPGDNIFSGIQVHTIKINFTQPNYWDTLTYYYNLGDEQYIPAEVTVDGTILENCGVRFKGNSSFSHPNNKKSFRISFDEFIDGQKWDGLKGVHLNNVYGDPTFMREKVYLDFCKDAGIAAPRANYASLYINDTLFAFYSLIEHVDKKFLTTRFGNNNGDLFKAIDGFDDNSLVSDFKWITAVADSYYTRYELKTDESTTAWGNLVNLLDSINNSSTTTNSLSATINLNTLYNSIAADIIFANLDSYIGSGRNFYFYFNPTSGKMEWIKWDVGLSFGDFSGGVSNFENLSLTYLINSTNRPLISKILGNSSLKNSYLNSLCNINSTYFIKSTLYSKIDTIANIIRPYIYNDTRKQYTNAQFEQNLSSDLSITSVGGGTRIPGLKSFINLRKNSITSQLTTLGINCEVTVEPGDVVINEFMAQNDTITDPAGEKEDWIELYNNTDDTINLGGMYLSDSYTSPTKWQFPENTLIEPNSFLIVWADEDDGQEGIHASFKLSAGGEQIILSNIDNTVLDSISFGAQTTNLTMARKPNGTGSFIQSEPTFNSNNDSITSIDEIGVNLIEDYTLLQNYPNPFNPSTIIEYHISNAEFVSLKIYDILGKEIAVPINEYQSAGSYKINFNANAANYKLASGIYFYKLSAGNFTKIKQMLLLK